jgi:hypothetical protein
MLTGCSLPQSARGRSAGNADLLADDPEVVEVPVTEAQTHAQELQNY